MKDNSIPGIGTADTGRVLDQIGKKNPKALLDMLVSMAGEKGFNTKQGAELAKKIMDGVAEYETTRELLESNAEDALSPLFKKMEKEPPEVRILILDQMLFGLECAENDVLLERAKKRGFRSNGVTLYKEIRGTPPVWTPEKETELKAALVEKTGSLNLSKHEMERMAKKLTHGDYVATAAAFGREGYFLKCATAMHLYLESGERASVQEAVAEACTGVDAQALGDAVHRGQIVEKVAKILLGLALGAALILTIQNSCLAGEAVARAYGAQQGFIIPTLVSVDDFIEHWLTVGGRFNQIADRYRIATLLLSGMLGFLPDLAGKLTAAFPNLVQKNAKAVEQGFEKINAYTEVQEKEVEGEPVFEADDESFTEAEDIPVKPEFIL